jgi:hypothetical protein
LWIKGKNLGVTQKWVMIGIVRIFNLNKIFHYWILQVLYIYEIIF